MFNLIGKIDNSLAYIGVALYSFALFSISILFIAVIFWGVRNILKIKHYKQHSYFWMTKFNFYLIIFGGLALILLGLFLMSLGIRKEFPTAGYGNAFQEMAFNLMNFSSLKSADKNFHFYASGSDLYILIGFICLFIATIVVIVIKRKYDVIAAKHNNKLLKSMSNHHVVFDKLVFDLKHKLQPAHLTYSYDMIQRIKNSVYLESDFKKLSTISDVNELITLFPKNTFYINTIEKDHQFAGVDGLFELNNHKEGKYIKHKNLLMPSSGHVEKVWHKRVYMTTNPRDKANVELHNFLTWMGVEKMVITTNAGVEEHQVNGITSALEQIQGNLDRIFKEVKRGTSVLIRYNFMDNYSFIQFAQYFDYCKEEVKEIKSYEDEILRGKTGLI